MSPAEEIQNPKLIEISEKIDAIQSGTAKPQGKIHQFKALTAELTNVVKAGLSEEDSKVAQSLGAEIERISDDVINKNREDFVNCACKDKCIDVIKKTVFNLAAAAGGSAASVNIAPSNSSVQTAAPMALKA